MFVHGYSVARYESEVPAMVVKRRKLSNPLALAVLVTLWQKPMHPYEIAQKLRRQGKDTSTKINYGSLYTVVQSLEKHGFVEVTGRGAAGQPARAHGLRASPRPAARR